MTIKVCIGSSCHLKGSRQVIESLKDLVRQNGLEDSVVLAGQFCMGDCQNGVCLSVDGEKYSLRPDDVESFFEREVLARLA
ncbi:MAG: NAD(P)H-dependent oxidoreductase subunit E [Clostridia bacterium]|nr:NAD(P)H-dependent oxidoreductase subunit E [Clostridia bacterium]